MIALTVSQDKAAQLRLTRRRRPASGTDDDAHNPPGYDSLGLMMVVALDWKAGINPVLLAFSVVTHIGVSEHRQFTGGVL